ncbi:hypothetical protein HELRODRAFT_162173 [Helobdella robusta]|uniref:Uncharacterized protein n=1 Tax=Helobdella robusta TaxID=6412 RepID=T1ESB6_HELRO|nr:hypothetical protein HELRODRAFT_162173 [Helobdella robusta]ESN98722.1 hypothetical protein HELRODRAFT_162173 [Helobdella robusta]
MGKGGKPKKDGKSNKKGTKDKEEKPKGDKKKSGEDGESAREICDFDGCKCYNQLKVILLFTFDEELKCAVSEICQIQLLEALGSEINARLFGTPCCAGTKKCCKGKGYSRGAGFGVNGGLGSVGGGGVSGGFGGVGGFDADYDGGAFYESL